MLKLSGFSRFWAQQVYSDEFTYDAKSIEIFAWALAYTIGKVYRAKFPNKN